MPLSLKLYFSTMALFFLTKVISFYSAHEVESIYPLRPNVPFGRFFVQ